MSDFKTLLPSNTAHGLKDFERVAARLGDLPVEIQKLWNPAECPEHLLGWLAWTLSVDVWEQDWSVETKRAVLAESVKVHRIKGTKKAVETALEPIGFDTDISEWFETGDVPYTFRIDAYGDDVFEAGLGINTKTFNLVKRSIEHVKPARAHFSLRIGERFPVTTTAKPGIRRQTRHRTALTPQPRTHDLIAAPGLEAGIRRRTRMRLSLTPQPRPQMIVAAQTLKSGVRMKQCHRAEFAVIPREGALYAK